MSCARHIAKLMQLAEWVQCGGLHSVHWHVSAGYQVECPKIGCCKQQVRACRLQLAGLPFMNLPAVWQAMYRQGGPTLSESCSSRVRSQNTCSHSLRAELHAFADVCPAFLQLECRLPPPGVPQPQVLC